jgi:hypothetical protein
VTVIEVHSHLGFELDADNIICSLFKIYPVGNLVELETVAACGGVRGLPSLSKLKRCYRRRASIVIVEAHQATAIDIEPRGRMVAKVDAIVKAHKKGVGVSEKLVSKWLSHRAHLDYNFPMIPALLPLTSAGSGNEPTRKTYVNV